ncbi:MAG: thioredoxin [Bacteroidetes bacterium]|nr:thioredoxin [Bacteroidota bacterium]
MSHPIVLTDDSFDAEVLKSDKPVMVDFWATWCAPCRMIAPVVEEMAKEYDGKAKICKIDVDANPAVASKFGIMSIPSILFFKNGELVDKIVGAVPKSQLISKLQSAI